MASIELMSPFPLDDCIWRLKTRVGSRFTKSGPVVGHVVDGSFWIERRIAYRNSFGTRLRGHLTQEKDRTRISCRVGMNPLILGLVVFWFTGVTGGFLFTLVRNFSASFVPLVMLVGGAAIVGLGRLLAWGDRDVLVEFVRNSLNATDSA